MVSENDIKQDQEQNIGRVWYNQYPEGVPFSLNEIGYDSLADMLQQICHKAADKDVFVSMGKSITYRQFNEKSEQLAAYMQHELGLVKGDRIAIMLPNLIQYPIAMFAALKLGLIVVNFNPLYTSAECEHQLKDSGCKAIVVLSNFANTIAEIYQNTDLEHFIVTDAGDMLGFKGSMINTLLKIKGATPKFNIPGAISWKSIFKKKYELQKVNVSLSDIAFLQYTGGTTGVSKGAILTHKNLISNIMQGWYWVSPLCGVGGESVVVALPLYHIFSLTVCLFCFLYMHGRCLLIVNPRDIKSFVKDLSKFKGTGFIGLNTLFLALLKNKAFRKLDFSSYKLTLSGGMPLQAEVAKEWYEVTKVKMYEGYGLTEASPLVSCLPMKGKDYNGSVGVPISATDVEIRDEHGSAVMQGQEGEVCVRGPQIMQGYWHNSEATNNAIDAGGWFKTGDIGYFDAEGYLFLVDRKKDMIIVSGFNVYPNEVENVISTHPLVDEVAVIGEDCDRAGEKVKAVIVANDSKLTKDEVINFCRKRLTAYKVPKIVEFVDDLPKSNVGKVLRRSLRKEKKADIAGEK